MTKSWFLHSTMSVKYFYVVSLWIVVIVLWWFCIYQPIEHYLITMQNKINLSNQQYVDMVNVKMTCDRLEDILTEFNVYMPSSKDSSDNTVSNFLSRITYKTVEVQRYNLHTTYSKHAYKVTPITVNKRTRLNDFIDLHNQLYQQRVPVRCTKIGCRQIDDDYYEIICDYRLIKNKRFIKEPLNL